MLKSHVNLTHCLTLLLFAILLGTFLSTALGQGGSRPATSYPSETYYAGLASYRSGDLAQAIRLLESALSRTRIDENGRWVDAIPVHAMLAECHFETGNLAQTHKHLDEVMKVALRQNGWLGRLEWDSPANGAIRQPRRVPNWWMGKRLGLASYSRKVRILMTSLDAQGLIESGSTSGNLIVKQQYLTIDAVEILRGLATSLYRRHILLGPLATEQPSVARAISTIRRPRAVHAVARASVASVKMLGAIADGGGKKAAESANAVAMVLGNRVHPLTAVVLCGAARALAASDKPEGAYPLAIQASAAATLMGQPEWVAEAFRIAVGVSPPAHLASLYKSARSAARLYDRDSPLATAQLETVAAEAALQINQLPTASESLNRAASLLNRRRSRLPRSDAYFRYVLAKQSAAMGNPQAASTALKSLLKFALGRGKQLTIPRAYQLRIITQASHAGTVGNKKKTRLLSEYLPAPPDAVWRADPVEAIGYLMMDRSAVLTAWLLSAVRDGSASKSLDRGDRLARFRFLFSRPLSGRLLQARWLAAASPEQLSDEGKAFRKSKLPVFKKLRQLAGGPPLENIDGVVAQANQAEQLTLLLALQRTQLPVVFPPRPQAVSSHQSLPKRTAILTFIAAGKQLVGVMSQGNKSKMWLVGSPGQISKQIANLLRQMGVGRKRGGQAQLSDPTVWRTMATELRQALIPKDVDLSELKRLVIVPAGPMWYLPFELLPIDGTDDASLLGDVLQIRYAPTTGLARFPILAVPNDRSLGLVSSRFFAPRDRNREKELVESVHQAAENLKPLPGDNPVSGRWIGSVAKQVIVAAPLTPSKTSTPLAWPPLLYDQGKPGGLLEDWLLFPWQAPETVVLAGLRTAAGQRKLGSGDELFLNVLAFQGAGVRNLVCSRWPVGGESTACLLREFVQELPVAGFDPSWQRALQMLRQTELDPSGEPLLSAGDKDLETLTGDRPLFWAGYMVFSSVFEPKK